MTQTNNTNVGPNPSGLCMCGCGQKTSIAKQSDARRGWVRGEPISYVSGHNQRNSGAGKVRRECTYCSAEFFAWPFAVREGKARYCSKVCARQGDALLRRLPPEQRFWEFVDRTDACWLWNGALNAQGYGVFNAGSRTVLAHQFGWTMMYGPVPDGLVLDHVRDRGCTHRNCVNPAHLEPVTQVENMRRSRRAN